MQERFHKFVSEYNLEVTKEKKWLQTNLMEFTTLGMKMVFMLVEESCPELDEGIYVGVNISEEDADEDPAKIEEIRTIAISAFLDSKYLVAGDYDLEQYITVNYMGTITLEGEKKDWALFNLTHEKNMWKYLRGEESSSPQCFDN